MWAGVGAGAGLASCAPSSHCYGITDANESYLVSGAIAGINTHSLSSGNYCTGFATSELWLYTGSGFVENGIIAGMHANGACGSGDQFFWGEFSSNNPNIYDQHFPGGSVGLNTIYSQKIVFLQSLSFEVDRNGSTIGFANYSSCCGTHMNAGGESSIGTFSDSGEASGLQKQVQSTGAWSYGWTGAVVVNQGGAFTMSGTPASDESWSH